ncbi:MAG: DNA-3-methyladenine glycosylase family protein [Sporichthyaceae bacterium]
MSASDSATSRERIWSPGRALDLHRTVAVLRRGAGDPCYVVDAAGAIWRGVRTPDGPGTLRLAALRGSGEVAASAWGPGADWLLERVPRLCGADDDPSGFVPRHPVLREAFARHPGMRMTSADQVVDLLVPSILEQKTTGKQARGSWRYLVLAYGSPAPGPAPAGLRVPPTASEWARIPSWEWHRAGVEPPQSRTVVAAMRYAGRLEETVALGTEAADARLRALPGIGVWTSAEVRQRSHGDADAVSVGDYHLSNQVGYALTGRRVDDAQMLELLAPYAGHRHRACLFVGLSGIAFPRYGPRLTIQDHRAH